ncbi:sigma-54 interaction domain-containing protein [Desulfovibrio psychrotolerans]|uniref:Sigma-54-dependent Fis family transcriptional regulator n=1 Tax=Desulfovibrio psychrotolerans TaxID=415242 RepID=A0A7J0BT22_9BACT|nr:sigma 54-interacting transcriptional regulator [Desulfovibrio psychrotolerans]GFM36867.1 sigma-54-dependent Fis family transcriptional regulator [Desulfovibrio psychrotolerans]
MAHAPQAQPPSPPQSPVNTPGKGVTGGITPLLTGLLPQSVAADALLDSLPFGIAVLSAEKRIVRLNSRAQALLGVGDEAHGLPCYHVVRSARCLRECPVPAILRSLRATQDEPAESGSCRGETAPCDTDILDRQRRKVPVRSCVLPLCDPAGGAVGYLEVLEEATCPAPGLPQQEEGSSMEGFIARSPAMQPLFSAMRIIAETDSTLLITGETGTGKDLLAEGIHKASPRSGGPFVKVNCGALPEHLLESELFGHMRGAFTGAVSDKPGRFRLAAGGTLFLTEIGDLPLALQVKLLTVLDDQCVHPLGATRPVSVDVRIIAATHRNLEAMVREGTFRQDLLFRLNVVRLHVPPLRDRDGDIPALLDHFLRRFSASTAKSLRGFTPQAMKILCEYPWPGNVRELRNVVEYAVHFTTGDMVDISGLPASILAPPAEALPSGGDGSAGRTYTAPHAPRPPEGQSGQEPGQPEQATTPPPAAQGVSGTAPQEQQTFRTWQEKERSMILDALARTGGRKQEAADTLGWSRSTLWRKMKQHALE